MRFCEENHTFYLCGAFEKNVTFFTLHRNRSGFSIGSLAVNAVVVDFEVFPFFETVLVCD